MNLMLIFRSKMGYFLIRTYSRQTRISKGPIPGKPIRRGLTKAPSLILPGCQVVGKGHEDHSADHVSDGYEEQVPEISSYGYRLA